MESHWNSSYVYGYDNVSGWGNRYFFTYFNEFGHRHITSIVVEVTMFIVIFILSIIANVAIATCVFRFSDMKTVTNSFVLNLAGADLLFALSMPAVAYTRISTTWSLGVVSCKLIPYSQYVSGIVLLWTLALISMDRHRCIVIPPYRSKLSATQAYCISATIWILTAVLFLPVAFWFQVQTISTTTSETNVNNITTNNFTSNSNITVNLENTSENITSTFVATTTISICTMVFPKSTTVDYAVWFTIIVVICACLLPMVILIYHYQSIFKKILSTKNTWASSCVTVSTASTKTQGRRNSELSLSDILTSWPRKFSSSSNQLPVTAAHQRHASLSRHEELRLNRHVKVVRVLFLNVIMVLLMWLPITIVMGLIFLDGRRTTDNTNFFLRSHHFVAALMIAFLNTIVNPVLYGILSDNFRACLVRMWCRRRGGEERSRGKGRGGEKETRTPSSATRTQQCNGNGNSNAGHSGKVNRKQSFINSISERDL